MNKCGTDCVITISMGNKTYFERTHCSPLMPHNLIWDRTRTAVMRRQRLSEIWLGLAKLYIFSFFGFEWNSVHYYSGHYRPTVPAPDDDRWWWWWVWSNRWNDWQGKPKYSEKTCPVPLCSPQILHDLIRAELSWVWTTALPKGEVVPLFN
jgi:hypothetical protein